MSRSIKVTTGKFSPQEGGLVLGWSKDLKKIYCNTDDTHSLVIGTTRSGKTRHLVLQSIGFSAMANESMIVSDPKGELYLFTGPYLKTLGYEVITIDFKNPERSNRYNFLQPVLDAVYMGNLSLAVSSARDIANLLVPDKENTSTDPLWPNGERAILTVAILAVCLEISDPRWQNLDNARHFIGTMCATPSDPKQELPLIAYLEKLPETSPLRRAMAIAKISPEKMRGSFYSSGLTTLDLFADAPIHDMTAVTDFDHLATGDRKRAIFIILPDEKSTYYPLASLFVFQQYQLLVRRADENGGRLPRRVEFFLDEFGNFVRVPDMDKAITVGGGRGCRFHLFVQDTTQIYEKYGEKLGKTMTSNCETWVYLYTKNTDTIQEIGQQLGKYTVKSPSLSASTGGQSSASYNLTGRDLLTTEEIKRISRPYQLVMGRSDPVMMYAPDISKTFFNTMFGMGSKRHNQKLQIYRNSLRPSRTPTVSYWDGYKAYTR
ncbi:MAG: type IV secretory system conjugative DNA transfer family protein [Oscillospiraceae bacterium]|nr:type IV secretory system conjugative DNA transfer family protein [Oscillospiraceae bacterium]